MKKSTIKIILLALVIPVVMAFKTTGLTVYPQGPDGGHYTLPTSAPQAGQYMIADGNSNLIWGDPSSANSANMNEHFVFAITDTTDEGVSNYDIFTDTDTIYDDPNTAGSTSPPPTLKVNNGLSNLTCRVLSARSPGMRQSPAWMGVLTLTCERSIKMNLKVCAYVLSGKTDGFAYDRFDGIPSVSVGGINILRGIVLPTTREDASSALSGDIEEIRTQYHGCMVITPEDIDDDGDFYISFINITPAYPFGVYIKRV